MARHPVLVKLSTPPNEMFSGSDVREVYFAPIRVVKVTGNREKEYTDLAQNMREVANTLVGASQHTRTATRIDSPNLPGVSGRTRTIEVTLNVDPPLRNKLQSSLQTFLNESSRPLDPSTRRILELAAALVYETSGLSSISVSRIHQTLTRGSAAPVLMSTDPNIYDVSVDADHAFAAFLGADDCMAALQRNEAFGRVSQEGQNDIRKQLLDKAGWGVWKSLQTAIDGERFDEESQAKITGPGRDEYLAACDALVRNPSHFHWADLASQPYVQTKPGGQKALLPPHLLMMAPYV